MTAVLRLLFAGLAGLSLLATVVFIGRALQAHSQSGREAYGFGRQESRMSMQANLLWGFLLLILVLVLFAAFGLAPRLAAVLPAPAATPGPTVAGPTVAGPTETVSSPKDLPPTAVPTAGNPPPATPTLAQVTPTPTSTPTPVPTTATVSSGVGVWLRTTPGLSSEQLEYLLDGTVLTLQNNQQTADGLLWQQVTTPSGNIGWVAVDFIINQ